MKYEVFLWKRECHILQSHIKQGNSNVASLAAVEEDLKENGLLFLQNYGASRKSVLQPDDSQQLQGNQRLVVTKIKNTHSARLGGGK